MVPLKSIIKNFIVASLLTFLMTIVNVKIIQNEEIAMLCLTSFILFCLFLLFTSSFSELLKNGSSIRIIFKMLISIDSIILIESFDAASVLALKGQNALATILFVLFAFSFVNIFVLYAWAERRNIDF